MRQLFSCFAIFVVVFGSLGCKTKPTESQCRQAIENIRRIAGQTESQVTPVDRWIRQCVGRSTVDSVQCRIAAKTQAELDACKGD